MSYNEELESRNAVLQKILEKIGLLPSDAVRYGLAQELTEEQKAQARANIGASAGEEVEFADSIEWLNEYGDKTKKYVLPDGYIYTWTTKWVDVEFDANDGTGALNKYCAGAMGETMFDKPGNWVSPFVSIDPTVMAPVGAAADTVVTISGLEKIVPVYNNTAIWIYYYKQDGSQMGAYKGGQLAGIYSDSELSLPLSVNLKNTAIFADSNWASVYGVRISLGISASGSITEEDVADLRVRIPFFDYSGEVEGWHSTGQQHSNDKATQQNSADIAALKERVDGQDAAVKSLQTAADNAGLTAPAAGQVVYGVGDSIMAGYGIGGTSQSWLATVIEVNGYDAAASKNLAQSGLGFCSTSASGNTIEDVVGGTDFGGADLVLVALGINDWKNTGATLTDLWNGMEYAVGKIRGDNPYCKIVYVLPFNAHYLGTADTFYCLGAKGDSNTERPYAHTLMELIRMIKDRFESEPLKSLDVHLIDMTECPALNRRNITTALIDGLHTSAETNVLLGRDIARRLLML